MVPVEPCILQKRKLIAASSVPSVAQGSSPASLTRSNAGGDLLKVVPVIDAPSAGHDAEPFGPVLSGALSRLCHLFDVDRADRPARSSNDARTGHSRRSPRCRRPTWRSRWSRCRRCCRDNAADTRRRRRRGREGRERVLAARAAAVFPIDAAIRSGLVGLLLMSSSCERLRHAPCIQDDALIVNPILG